MKGEEEDKRERIKTGKSAVSGEKRRKNIFGNSQLRNEEKKDRNIDKIGRRRQNIHRKEGIKTERFAEGK